MEVKLTSYIKIKCFEHILVKKNYNNCFYDDNDDNDNDDDDDDDDDDDVDDDDNDNDDDDD